MISSSTSDNSSPRESFSKIRAFSPRASRRENPVRRARSNATSIHLSACSGSSMKDRIGRMSSRLLHCPGSQSSIRDGSDPVAVTLAARHPTNLPVSSPSLELMARQSTEADIPDDWPAAQEGVLARPLHPASQQPHSVVRHRPICVARSAEEASPRSRCRRDFADWLQRRRFDLWVPRAHEKLPFGGSGEHLS